MKLYTIKNLGEKPVSREELRSLFVLVDDRFENGKPTTFTSRFSPAEIVERLTTTSDDHVMASAIVGRLVEMNAEATKFIFRKRMTQYGT